MIRVGGDYAVTGKKRYAIPVGFEIKFKGSQSGNRVAFTGDLFILP